ncbi:hypothetical protein TSOC_009335 [Tetrabaena socialis]|uniref:Uncharacterized protein n=1 Tax=Tetrabaena socialis TaxID=47790 RepID=A0A2J7ZW53_9CHLO|nr:hypothetical protein TSOC_009335 [Tetrabaena socialis]|eukprot:PNH04507.1 hypothetical protein TSOC_009335 [Tetrabaena socialis]
MAYNLFQVQMSNAWVQRINKENATAEKFLMDQSMGGHSMPASPGPYSPGPYSPAVHVDNLYAEPAYAGSVARSHVAKSVAPSGFTSKTGFLRSKLEKLESELSAERESRKKVEADLADLKSSMKRR